VPGKPPALIDLEIELRPAVWDAGEGSALVVAEQCACGLEIRLVHEDLARADGREVLERRVDRIGFAEAALDPGRPQETADDLGLGLVGNDLHHDRIVHGGSVHPSATVPEPVGQCGLRRLGVLFLGRATEGGGMRSIRALLMVALVGVLSSGAVASEPARSQTSSGEIAYSLMRAIQTWPYEDQYDQEGDYEICAMAAAGGRGRLLTDLAASDPWDFNSSPAWSADGQRLAYSRRGGISIMNADASGQAPILGTEGGWDPSFGPDDLIVFAFQNEADQIKQIKTVRLDGTELKLLRSSAYAPDWSRDGKRIVFVDLATRKLSSMNPDGTDVVPITAGAGVVAPSWSPDGKRIAFVVTRRGSDTIEIVNADGSGRKVLIKTRPEATRDGGVSWSPDGERLAFVKDRPDGFTDIYVMDDDGSNLFNVTNTPLHESDPAWRPNSTEPNLTMPRNRPPCGLGGTPRNDVLTGSVWADYVLAIGGRDTITTLYGRDVIAAGAGDDTILAGDSTDYIRGEDGNDRIFGQGGGDHISGGNGNDRIVGGSGPDVIGGGAGNDVILVRDGTVDIVTCGLGRDTVYADRRDEVPARCEAVYRR
jgi:WD40-like Beta Propeller Repeat/RTX calcium-binding nonapeptide repeat (4 copies)